MSKEKIKIDEIIKIIFMTDNKELIKFVNKNLGKKHDPKNSKVVRLAAEFNFKNTEQKYNKRIADAIFSIDGCLYNIEFQTARDGKMLIRLMEYQFNAMLNNIKNMAMNDEYSTEIILPSSIVIQLEKSKNVSNHYRVTYIDSSTGETLTQKFPIVKMWEYSIEDLGKNGLHMLLPFKPLEHKKKNIDVDKFLEDAFDINEQIFNLYRKGVISKKFYKEMHEAYYDITKMVAKNYISKDNPKRKETDDMFTVIKEAPSLVKINMERAIAKEVAKVERKMAKEAARMEQKMAKEAAKEMSKAVAKAVTKAEARATAEKVVKASNLGWSKEEILEFFEMSVEQAQQILEKY